MNEDPRQLIAQHLDVVWDFLVSEWLVLKDRDDGARIERRSVEEWWGSLKREGGLSVAGKVDIERRPPMETNPNKFLESALAALSGFSAVQGDPNLNHALDSLLKRSRVLGGQKAFGVRVARAELRRNGRRPIKKEAVMRRARTLNRFANPAGVHPRWFLPRKRLLVRSKTVAFSPTNRCQLVGSIKVRPKLKLNESLSQSQK